MQCYNCEKPVTKGGVKIDGELHCANCASEMQNVLGKAVDNAHKLDTKKATPLNKSGKQCSKCGAAVSTIAKFCSGCGTALIPTPSSPRSPRHEQEAPVSPKTSPREDPKPAEKIDFKKRDEEERKKQEAAAEEKKKQQGGAAAEEKRKQQEATAAEERKRQEAAAAEEKKRQLEADEEERRKQEELAQEKERKRLEEEHRQRVLEEERRQKEAQEELNRKQQQQTKETKASGDSNRKILIGAHTDKGGRKKNEDAHVALPSLITDSGTGFFAVFDGHGGRKASSFCEKHLANNLTERKSYATDKKKALYKAILKTDEDYLIKMADDGCTAVVALITENNKLWVANVGDSRCVACKNGVTVPMTKDHKPNLEEEKLRIEESGHSVVKDVAIVNGARIFSYRIDGQIAVSRAIGDCSYKDNYGEPPEKQAVCCIPDITEEQLSPGDFIILACDGVWDVVSNEEAVQFVKEQRANSDFQTAAQKLVELALSKGSEDNITVVLAGIE